MHGYESLKYYFPDGIVTGIGYIQVSLCIHRYSLWRNELCRSTGPLAGLISSVCAGPEAALFPQEDKVKSPSISIRV